ncbi:MAG TPA: DUF1080 domain-containing protein [Panacibacter sp.]|nr:DUF1080 domain-containing protein [Panacibacter sp.]
MKKLPVIVIMIFILPVYAAAQFHLLFNGRDFTGWHMDVPAMDTGKIVKPPFIIRNGMIVLLAGPYGHLITDTVYQNFRLRVEYRFAAVPGNSGVLVHVSAPREINKMYPKSIEVQLKHNNAGDLWCIGENITAPDMENRRGYEDKPKGMYSSIMATLKRWSGMGESKQSRIVKLTGNTEKPAGEWNTLITECAGNNIKVWLNGSLVNYGYNCTATKGQIALQAEGCEVEFRKVELMQITKITE